MKSDRSTAVAIVGAGFSGTMVAAHLARRGISSILIEATDREGKGTAFSTSEPAHLLNVPAGNMSAWPDQPDSFAAVAGDGGSFAQRRRFGAYLGEILDAARSDGCATCIKGTVTAADRDGDRWRLRLDDGSSIEASALVLATGNQPPGSLDAGEEQARRIISNPWGDRATAAVADAAADALDVLIVGTGLTMVDVVLSLDSAGHRGNVVAVSRRGLMPKSHGESESRPVEWDDLPAGNLRAMARWLRRNSRQRGWRGSVDALRPHSHRLWQSLDLDQQQRFLRHARPWWDVHRHRIAPQVAQQLQRSIDSGRLRVIAGRICAMEADAAGVEVAIRKRGHEDAVRQRFGYVFNCTGPLHDIRRTRDPLLRNLLDAGNIEPDELAIGVAVDGHSRALGADRLWALGALTKGRYWEIIAVPDIRNQAAQVAQDIATELGQ